MKFLKKIHWFKTELHLRYVSQTIMSRLVGSYHHFLCLWLFIYLFIFYKFHQWKVGGASTEKTHTTVSHSDCHCIDCSHPAALLSCAMEAVVGEAGTGEHSQQRQRACAKASARQGSGGSVPAGRVTHLLIALNSFPRDGWGGQNPADLREVVFVLWFLSLTMFMTQRGLIKKTRKHSHRLSSLL